VHEEVAAYGHLMRQCRTLQNEFIRATQRYAEKDAHARIVNFVKAWGDPEARLWQIKHIRRGKEMSMVRRERPKNHEHVIFSRFEACNHELRFSWHNTGMWEALQTMFLMRSRGLRCVYQKAYIYGRKRNEPTTEYFVVVPMFDHSHLRHNKEDLDVAPYGVFLVKHDTRGIWTREHIITEDVRRMLWSRIKAPLRVVSKDFLSEFAGFDNITTTIGLFCASPYAPYRFKANYGRNP